MKPRLKSIAPLALLGAVFVWLYHPMLVRLWNQWANDENYTHGFFVIPVALFFAWERRHRLRAVGRRGVEDGGSKTEDGGLRIEDRGPALGASAVGLLVVLGSLALLIIGLLGAELFLTRASLLGTVVGSVLFVQGWQRTKVLFFPLAFLLLMIPLPRIVFDEIAFPLQLLAAQLGEAALLALNMPVLREGNLMILPKTTLEVVEACSGIRSLISLLMGVIIYAYFSDPRQWVRWTIVVSTVPVAIVANGLRLLGTGVAVQHYGPQAADDFFHSFSGWLIFLVAFLMIYLLKRLIVWIAPVTKTPDAPSTAKPLAVAPSPAYGRVLCLSGLLALSALGLSYATRTEAVPIRETLAHLPLNLASWQGRPRAPLSEKIVAALGVSDYVTRLYVQPGAAPVDLYIGYHRSQRTGETIHSPKNCLPGAGWAPIKSDRIKIAVGDGVIEANRYIIQKGMDKALVLYWYHGAGRVMASEYEAKLYLVLDSLRKNRSDGALVRAWIPIGQSEEAATRTAADFVKSLFPLLPRYLPA